MHDQSWYAALTTRSRPLTGRIRDDHARPARPPRRDRAPGASAALSVDTLARPAPPRTIAMRCSSASPAGSSPACGSAMTTIRPIPACPGGGIPARVWRDFMQQALGVGPAARGGTGGRRNRSGRRERDRPRRGLAARWRAILQGLGLNLHIGRDGSIEINRSNRDNGDPGAIPRRSPPRRDDRAPPATRRTGSNSRASHRTRAPPAPTA